MPHDFQVRATDPAGNVGPPSGTYSWTIDGTVPQVTILSQPADPTTATSASFTYAADEPNSTYQCALDTQVFASCPASGTSFSSLAQGAHTFNVKATDAAGNTGPAASFAWTVSPVTPPAPQAKIGKAGVKGPARVKQGGRAVYRVTVANAGTAAATGIRVTVKGRGANGRTATSPVPAGSARTLKVKLTPKRAGKIRLTFKVTSANAGTRTVTKRVRVLRR